MSPAVDSPWERLSQYDADQHRLGLACLGRETDPLLPFAGPETVLIAGRREQHKLPNDAIRMAYVAADGAAHLEAVLSKGDLLALGIGRWTFQHASEEVLTDVLSSFLQQSLRRASILLGARVTLRVHRLDNSDLPLEPTWLWFTEEPALPMGSLRIRLSRALIEACQAQPMPRRRGRGMRHIPLMWGLQILNVPVPRMQLASLAPGDVLRVMSPPAQAGVPGELLPHCGHAPGRSLPAGSGRLVRMLIKSGHWITLQFEKENPTEQVMQEQHSLDNPIVPLSLSLPVVAMSLHQIDGIRPGTLVDTGVRLQDVEVALSSAGHRLACGRLVVIGDHLGVEIGRVERNQP